MRLSVKRYLPMKRINEMNIYEQNQQIYYLEELKKDHKVGEIASEILYKLRTGFYKNSDWFGQYFNDDFITIADAYTFGTLHYWACSGKLMFTRVYLNISPNADIDTEWNGNALRNLPRPFSGIYEGGRNEDDDGLIFWNEPINLNAFDMDGIEHRKILQPGSCPLEVGTTTFIRTYFHLYQQITLARWPYNSKEIIIMSMDEEFWDSI